jgi:DNA-binding response OmpR family regulator
MNEGQKKILIAEDGEFLMRVYEVKLSKEGFNIVKAVDGEVALSLAQSEKPDVILLDLMLPKKSGFEVLAELKASAELKGIPVIVLTNLGQDTDVKKAMDGGASDYLIKANFSIDAVVEKIKKLLP